MSAQNQDQGGEGTGRMMKKLLFPASASGANDTFLNSNRKDVTASSTSSAPVMSSSQQHPTSSSNNSPATNSSGDSNNHRTASAAAPPRFFSSTHPTTAAETTSSKSNHNHSSSIHHHNNNNNNNNNNNSRVLNHWQKQKEAPPSPPPLDRRPVEIKEESGTENCETSPSDEEEEEEQDSQISNFVKDGEEVDNNNLQFLKDFKDKRDHKKSPTTTTRSSSSREYNDDAETEVHDNTTAYQQFFRTQQQHHEQEEEQQQQEEKSMETTEKQDSTNQEDLEEKKEDRTTQAISEISNHPTVVPETPTTKNDGSSNHDDKKQQHDHDNLESYPSYYDNPYHNPLVASALKPHDLFPRKNSTNPAIANNNDDDEDVSSDVDSNASEMGTVINAPNLYASRFAEVEAMELEKEAGNNNRYPEHGILEDYDDEDDDDDDPVLSNYKPFNAHDDEDHDVTPSKNNDSILSDPFQTPKVMDHGAEESTAVESAVVRKHKQTSDSGDGSSNDGSDLEEEEDDVVKSKPLHPPPNNNDARPTNYWMQEDYDIAMSEIDSEIDQLVRRSASESSGGGGGIVKSCSSNNSADVFRVPSTGSDVASRKSATSHHRHHHVAAVSKDEASRRAPNRIPRRDKESDGNKGAEQQIIKKEDEKEEKEEELHDKVQPQEPPSSSTETDDNAESDNYPGANLANTIRRIGTKLTQKTSPTGDQASTANPYFFDIDDDEVGDGSDNYNIHDQLHYNLHDQLQMENDFQYGNSLSAPSTPRQKRKDNRHQQQHHYHSNRHYSLSKIQEAFPPAASSSDGNANAGDHLEGGSAPSSFLLRSPGSSARLMADFRRESSGTSGSSDSPENNDNESQRFAFLKQRIPSILQTASSASLGNGPIGRKDHPKGHHAEAVTPSRRTNAIRYARGCLSFDTTADKQYEYDYEHEYAMYRAAANDNVGVPSSKSYDTHHHHHHQQQQHSSPSKPSAAFRQRFKGFRAGQNDSTQALYRSSQSWDVKSGATSSLWSSAAGAGGGTKNAPDERLAAVHLDASAFRTAPYVMQRSQNQHPHPLGFNNHNGRRIVSGERQERLRLMSDTTMPHAQNSNATSPQQQGNFEVLQTPQRIEIEREDALNLLACLCERGISLYPKEEDDADTEKSSSSDDASLRKERVAKKEPSEEKNLSPALAADSNAKMLPADLEPETIDAVIEALRKCGKVEASETNEKTPPSEPSQQTIEHVLDELRRSHTYANEMKRAALSASAWLRSIGHSDNNNNNNNSSGGIYEGELQRTEAKTETGQAAGEKDGGFNDDTMDLFAVKAMLHQVQMEAREKDAKTQQLNEELSKCRAEIGRLKSEESRAAKNDFVSPNRSILDDEDDDESAVSPSNLNADKNDQDKTKPVLTRNETDEGRVADESFVDLDSSLLANGEDAEVVRESDLPIARELAMFKSALSDANAVIRQLHSELQEARPGDDKCGQEAPIIEVSEKAFSRALVDDTQCSPGNNSSNTEQDPDRRTINVRMLDGENFVTDWDSLRPSLPPPPDHGLRSPIVSTLLEQWTTDRVLHNSLMSWMEKVMAGEDPSSIPPLTLSSLDHQVRDGFTMHVLPLLLRRSDILVDVKTRAHRTTTYDIAVSVQGLRRTNPGIRLMESSHRDNGETESINTNSATHSAATHHVRNGPSPDHFEVGSTAASYATGASSNDGIQQQGLMSALGGALGGLLSRRKQSNTSHYDAGLPANSSYEVGSAVGTPGGEVSLDAQLPPPGSAADPADMEPYHRLVSAPPGRIGVSFVEFRGHAVVSDVSQDSPLFGWIFPSDILIAIDEVPVSGMRLRDIIKVLQGRSERQRAMRVISSHAMSEFSMPSNLPS